MNLIEVLKRNLKKRGWTTVQLASRMKGKNGEAGISQPSMSQILNGNPTLNKLEEIAAIVGVPLCDLLHEDEGTTAALSPSVACPCCGAVLRVSLSMDEDSGDGGRPSLVPGQAGADDGSVV